MNHIAALKNLGLGQDEALAYLALLRLGGGSASAVAKEVGVKRTTIYPILKGLAAKGLASAYVQRGRHLYRAEKPDRVVNVFEKKLLAFAAIVPELKTLEKQVASVVGLRFIETKQELERLYDGVLTDYKNKSYVIIGSATAWEGIDPAFFVQFRKDRAKAGIKTRILLSADSAEASPTDQSLLREVRMLPSTHVFKSTIDIFPDKILVVNPNLTALAVVMEIPAMVDVFQSMFELLWDTGTVEKV